MTSARRGRAALLSREHRASGRRGADGSAATGRDHIAAGSAARPSRLIVRLDAYRESRAWPTKVSGRNSSELSRVLSRPEITAPRPDCVAGVVGLELRNPLGSKSAGVAGEFQPI